MTREEQIVEVDGRRGIVIARGLWRVWVRWGEGWGQWVRRRELASRHAERTA